MIPAISFTALFTCVARWDRGQALVLISMPASAVALLGLLAALRPATPRRLMGDRPRICARVRPTSTPNTRLVLDRRPHAGL